MDEFVAHGAAGPAAAEHRLVPIQSLLADLAMARLDGEQHRLPVAAGLSDAHGRGSIAKRLEEIQGAEVSYLTAQRIGTEEIGKEP
ncbi:hypothetical protein NITMOv2_0579 [Nitrospira moscoviensis]|uniref:Uncharacterized protein n=1 Tax=Nitrospira moscoviensis TaxID=42253 RepID=A0A0K2G7V9_NITMO|nr:hypothetical protein NITMOv2_0579 [Nitrospira moscoviensis]